MNKSGKNKIKTRNKSCEEVRISFTDKEMERVKELAIKQGYRSVNAYILDKLGIRHEPKSRLNRCFLIGKTH